MTDRFMWQEDDLEIEDPIGSGQFIPLREFNRRIAEEAARAASEDAGRKENAGEENPDR